MEVRILTGTSIGWREISRRYVETGTCWLARAEGTHLTPIQVIGALVSRLFGADIANVAVSTAAAIRYNN
jgi:hypothetical protein